MDHTLNPQEVNQIYEHFRYSHDRFSDDIQEVSVDRRAGTVSVTYDGGHPDVDSYAGTMSGDEIPGYLSPTGNITTHEDGSYTAVFDIVESPYQPGR